MEEILIGQVTNLKSCKSPLIRKPDSESGCVTGRTATNFWRKFDTDRSRDKLDILQRFETQK